MKETHKSGLSQVSKYRYFTGILKSVNTLGHIGFTSLI
jgi:hypothetical protein